MDGVAYLIAKTYTEDSIKQKIPVESEPREIFVTEESVTRADFFEAGRNGLRAELVLKTQAVNYSGEDEVIYNDVRYSIYRTWKRPDSDEIELHLARKTGV